MGSIDFSPFATVFFTTFLGPGFGAAAFFTALAGFLGAAFLAVILTAAFFVTDFLTAFFATFLAVALALTFLVADFFGVALLAAGFFTAFFTAAFFTVFLAAAFFAGAFLTTLEAFLADFLGETFLVLAFFADVLTLEAVAFFSADFAGFFALFLAADFFATGFFFGLKESPPFD